MGSKALDRPGVLRTLLVTSEEVGDLPIIARGHIDFW
jgi:hypothetical protein